MPRPKGVRPPNSAHPLYESWKGHRKRGLRKTMTFRDYVALAVTGGYRPGYGHRIVLNRAKTDISVNRNIVKEPAYAMWIRMMSCATDTECGVCFSWTDCLEFQQWVVSSLRKTGVDGTKYQCSVYRYDRTKRFSPHNCYLA